jgi:hypothetical protein
MEFILNTAPDQKTRWAKYICAAFLIMCALILTISFGLDMSPDSALRGTGERSISPVGQAPASAQGTELKESGLQGSKATVHEMTRSLTAGAEAEAAIQQMTFPGVTNPAEHHPVQIAYLEPEVGAPLTEAFSSPAGPGATRALKQTTRASLEKQVRNLLTEVESACEREDKQTLLAMLDERDPAFHAEYVGNAERLFKAFDDINVSFSGIKISPLNGDEVLVKAHVRVEGAFAITGSWTVLKNSDQSFTLRRRAGSGWRLCAVDR